MNFNCELVESKTNCPDSSIETLEVPNKDTMLVIDSEDNSRVGVADLDKKLQCNSEVTNNECGVPFAIATEDSAITFDNYLKRLKDDNIDESMTRDNSRSLPDLSISGDFETETSTAHPKQAIKKMLSENDEEMCVDALGGAIGSRHSSPLSVGCTQYHKEKERKPKRKQRKKRQRRSSGLVQKGLKTKNRAAAQERRKMVVVVSVIAAIIFLTAVLLIVITLHMSQNSNSKSLSMGGAPENQTAGNGEQDDHSFFHDVTSHLGSDTRNDRDNKTFTHHNSTSSAPDKKYPVL